MAGAKVTASGSSLPFQVLLYFNAWFFGMFILIEALLYIYKGQILPYSDGVLAEEIIILVLLLAAESLRMHFAMRGDLTERLLSLVFAIVLTLPSVGATIFFMFWQTYVLLMEFVMLVVLLAFQGVEFILAIADLITFTTRAKPAAASA